MRYCILVLLLPFLGGCGTMANMQGKDGPAISLGGLYEPRIFGGVRNDLRWTGQVISHPFQADCETFWIPAHILVGCWFLADMPVSLVGDIVTLPKIINDRDTKTIISVVDPDTTNDAKP